MSDEVLTEIGEPVLPEVVIDDADKSAIDTGELQESRSSKSYGSESLANGFIGVLSMASMAATKRTGIDMNMTEDEAEELHSAMARFGDSMGGAELPPWLTLILVTGTFVGGRYVTYVMEKEKDITNRGQDEATNIAD